MNFGGLHIELGYLLLILGIIIVIMTLMRRINQRTRQSAQKQRQYETARLVALESERERRTLVTHPKSKVSPLQTRIPMADPFGSSFTGNIQGIAAKWEAEVHQIGRQIIGQIDSKMAALQAITLEANRTANRLEVLVDHLEQIARQQIEWQQNQVVQHAKITTAEQTSVTAPPTVIAVTESIPEAAPLAEVLKELAVDLEGIHKAIKQSTTFDEQPEQATILRLSELQTKNLRSEVEMLSNYGLDSQAIAQRLNISLGEVDLILQVQQN